MTTTPLVHVRTPTYKRPDMLRRALLSLIDQTWQNWICDVYDDDPHGAGRVTCEDLADPRIRYRQNIPQKFASKNIDSCFSADNPHGADFFCVVEDDNQLMPRFMQDNIEVCARHGVAVVFRNQLMELDSGTMQARISDGGILDKMFKEGVYAPQEFRLSLLSGIGVSNGGLFWSARARSRLEVGHACTATLQEYMRTFAIAEPIYVAMEPLAIWAHNGDQTTRDLGSTSSYLRRELDLKRSIQILQRQAWRLARSDDRSRFLQTDRFAYDQHLRASGLVKGLIALDVGSSLSAGDKAKLLARGLLIRLAGRASKELIDFARQHG